MSLQKLPDFMQHYIDHMEDGLLEMYKLAREYNEQKGRLDNNLGAGGPNNELRRNLYNRQIKELKSEYAQKAILLAKANGYNEENRTIDVDEKTPSNNQEDLKLDPEQKKEEERAAFIAKMREAKEQILYQQRQP